MTLKSNPSNEKSNRKLFEGDLNGSIPPTRTFYDHSSSHMEEIILRSHLEEIKQNQNNIKQKKGGKSTSRRNPQQLQK